MKRDYSSNAITSFNHPHYLPRNPINTMSLNPAAKNLIFKTVEEHQVVVFVNNESPGTNVKEILQSDLFENVDVCILNVDRCREDESVAISHELTKLTRQPTFPHVWANGTYLGGYHQTKRAVKNGDMEYYLSR